MSQRAKNTVRTRVLTVTLFAAAATFGGIATGTTAQALDNPTPPSGGCVERQVKEINGYWWECKGGQWVHLPLRSAGGVKAPLAGSAGTFAPPRG